MANRPFAIVIEPVWVGKDYTWCHVQSLLVELLRNEEGCAVELLDAAPHVGLSEGDAVALERLVLSGLFPLAVHQMALGDGEAVEVAADVGDVVTVVGPVGHADEHDDVVGCGIDARLAVVAAGVGIAGERHRLLRMEAVVPLLASLA